MKFVKSKHCASLTNQHLMELLRIALTMYLEDFKQLIVKMEYHDKQ